MNTHQHPLPARDPRLRDCDPDALMWSDPAPTGLIEAFVQSKDPRTASEDILVLTDHHVGIFDGMSTPLRSPGQHRTGRLFAQVAARTVARLGPTATAREAVHAITQNLAGIRTPHEGPSGAVAAIVSIPRREVWRIGDIHLAIGEETLLGVKDVDRALELFRAAIDAARLAQGWSLARLVDEDPGLALAAPLLQAQPALANHEGPFGYGVLNAMPVPDPFIEVYPIPDDVDVVLASDGFLGPDPTLQIARRHLTEAVEADPLGLSLTRSMAKPLKPGLRAPDDCSYLRIHVGRTPTPPSRKDPS